MYRVCASLISFLFLLNALAENPQGRWATNVLITKFDLNFIDINSGEGLTESKRSKCYILADKKSGYVQLRMYKENGRPMTFYSSYQFENTLIEHHGSRYRVSYDRLPKIFADQKIRDFAQSITIDSKDFSVEMTEFSGDRLRCFFTDLPLNQSTE